MRYKYCLIYNALEVVMKYSHMLLMLGLGVCAAFNAIQAMEPQESTEIGEEEMSTQVVEEEPMVRKGPMTQQERHARRSEPMSIRQTEQSKLTPTITYTTESDFKSGQPTTKKKWYSWK